ncbi:twin-arginine translocase TatA/TatE family subunit [Paraglaciecola sp. L1A13]|jgi:sec-independent protein translocase protein TatA|uniref:twin-arginine translocase TatA/TatE family subunit n=1 Tax=Paraglaciecola sp. L1A13 TaxID=2686359 RepID=UPI00131C3913|nr:twin-arginine translocase TatA/TatE family subunit [Paraglaciecola sp. L1A13]|tara:strand:+ start:4867 stop:5127 length:261 start_codon:yes stop_codon:yes gene_type:complete
MFGISPMQLIIILVIVVLLFGTKKLRNMGGDLGSAVKGFKKAISDEDKEKDADFKADGKVEDTTTDKEKTVQNNVKSESDTKAKSE